MKYLLFISLSILGSCTTLREYYPDQVSFSPSIEWEIQEGNKIVSKPKAQVWTNWNIG